MDLVLNTDERGNYTVVVCEGELDTYNCGTFRSAVIELLDNGAKNLIINLSALVYADCTGLGSLVGSLKRTRERGGELYYCCDNPQLEKVLEITGLDKVFLHGKTLEETIQLISKDTDLELVK